MTPHSSKLMFSDISIITLNCQLHSNAAVRRKTKGETGKLKKKKANKTPTLNIQSKCHNWVVL